MIIRHAEVGKKTAAATALMAKSVKNRPKVLTAPTPPPILNSLTVGRIRFRHM